MSVFFKGEVEEVVLFSPLEGQLLFNGEPAANAKIIVWIAWKDKEGKSHEFETDKNGRFHITQISEKYQSNPLAQLSVAQRLTVHYKEQKYLIWKAGKTTPYLFGELGGEPQNLTCELTEEELKPYLDHALVATSCTWSSITKE